MKKGVSEKGGKQPNITPHKDDQKTSSFADNQPRITYEFIELQKGEEIEALAS